MKGAPLLGISRLAFDLSRKVNMRAIGGNSTASVNYAPDASFVFPSSTSIFIRRYGTADAGKNELTLRPKSSSRNTSTSSEDNFKVSFRDLGMNRITKFVVYAIVGVLGTMETIFWCKVLWRWWTGDQEKDEGTK
ncbi:putative cutinase transcription factor 1 protein [Rosellinia necatrix]|uniref:Putative cutinase transcription factor 1 protein n=1 Tax=Rosellinia necatrix TaxID=77044 RepID=A0A1S7ULF1_ROSNE|nr:putative cutinase transcription factor 1 protein [Rosellinia necatrix]